MQFSIATVVAFLSLTMAAPGGLRLDNGNATVDVTIVPRTELLPRGGLCSGSAKCSNSDHFKRQCNDALAKVDAAHEYSDGGKGSGVCSGTCGLFVQGRIKSWIPFVYYPCTAYGSQLRAAVTSIHGNGCETCGYITTPQNNACKIKQDYVTGC